MRRLLLFDKSAFVRAQRNDQAREFFRRAAGQNLVATCIEVALEILYSARNASEYRSEYGWLTELEWLPGSDEVARLALASQMELAKRGHHRVSTVDLMIAATAQTHGAELVHYDKHFDVIAEVTGQTAHWIVPRGSAE